MKCVYVTPKPVVLFVTNELGSPLSKVLNKVYDVHYASSYSSIEGIDAVIIDNQAASTISNPAAQALKKYLIKWGRNGSGRWGRFF